MNILQSKSVYHQPEGIPQNLLIWQDENSGIAALTQAAADIVKGKIVTFALCDREGTQQPTIKEIVNIGMGNNNSPRFCGENKNPDGAGSCALIASWYNYAADPTAISTAMALTFKFHSPHYFRLR